MDLEKIGVIGFGVIGHEVAEVLALSGYKVVTTSEILGYELSTIEDRMEKIEWSVNKFIEKGQIDETDADEVLNKIEFKDNIEEAVEDVDFVVESTREDLELKRKIFSVLSDYSPKGIALTTTTSSLSVSEIAEATNREDKVIGMHWLYPPVMSNLVEITPSNKTSEKVFEITRELAESSGKVIVKCRKDVPGFIVNSVMSALWEEPAWMLSEGEATVEEADSGMCYHRGYPQGPFEMMDGYGIDTTATVIGNIRKREDLPIPPVFEEKLEKNQLGEEAGKGFYDYEEGKGVDYSYEDGTEFDSFRVEARILNEAAKLVEMDVATPEEIDMALTLGGGFPEGPCRRADRIGIKTIKNKLDSLGQS